MSLLRYALPLRVAGIYFAASLAYIVFSDWLVEVSAGNEWQPGIQTVKGFAFVLVSAILIFILIFRDLRRLQALEFQLARSQRMEAVGQLTNGVAHDFNNFLTVILGNLELIQDEVESNSVLRKRADHALLATERGADLTRRLLAFSRKQSVEPRAVDVNDCVAQMKMLLAGVLGEGITVTTELDPDLPPIVTDPGQLETALLNLALNARDAMCQGGQLRLSTKAITVDTDQKSGKWQVRKGSYVAILVTDTGHGMSKQVLDQLMVPFFTTKAAGKGTGLGLSTTHSFMKQTGGHVVVTSEVGVGTTVSLYFPVALPSEKSMADPVVAAADARGHETILLVENDIDVRDVLAEFLTQLGYHVLLAGAGAEADERLRGGPPIDLLMTDIVLDGERNGVDLANEIRKTHSRLPVLLISGTADASIADLMEDRANVGWLAKPISRHLVSKRLRELLDGAYPVRKSA